MVNQLHELRRELGRDPQPEEVARKYRIPLSKAQGLLAQRVIEPKIKSIPVLSIEKSILGVLTIGSYTLSLYFTALWFLGKFHIVISVLISFVMVTYMITAPHFSRDKSFSLRLIIWLTFLIAMVFSMGSTIAGQYNQGESSILNIVINTEQEIIEQIKQTEREKEIHVLTLEQLSGSEEKRKENWQSIATERRYIDQFNGRLDILRSELKESRESKKKEIKSGAVTNRFELWVSSLFNIDAELTRFWISALPAVFIDVISATCFSLLMKKPGASKR